ncbi:MAG: peptidylprolyl isomerase [Lachnospiraceae bacterium]
MKENTKRNKKIRVKKIIAPIVMTVALLVSCVGCGKTISIDDAKKTVVMTIGDHDVTLSEYNLFAMQYITMQALNPEDITDEKIESMKADITAEVKLEIVEYLLAQKTDGLTLTDEEKANIKTNTDNYMEKFGADFLAQYGIDEEAVTQLFTEQAYISALTAKAKQDLADDAYEENVEKFKGIDFHSVYYALFPSIEYDENGNPVVDSAGNTTDLSDDKMKEQKKNAEALQKRAAAGEKLEDLIEEYGIAASSGEERNYQGAYEDKLNKVLENMKEGDISEVIETDAGYMIVRMDNPKDEDYKDYALHYAALQTANSMIPTLQQNWLSASGYSEVEANESALKKVDFKDMCKKMKANGLY